MKLVKCNHGHFYDTEKFTSCPHCEASGNDNATVPLVRNANVDVTVPLSQGSSVTEAASQPMTPPPMSSSLQEAVSAAIAPPQQEEKTVGFFSSTIGSEPVVGWLVCVEGEHFGEDFKLKSGRNFVGRAPGMDVAITKDGTVSRERHTAIVYEPKGNMFIVQPGDSKELSYLNGEVVLSPIEIKAHDRLTVGKTELMFIPCCTESFKWETEKNKTEDK
ncbi:MAG: FHA domain-containing protein [Oscillospiraceae bacterium]|jgi:hypothetical protein|nr:FHA domain-containing protein [Oscillospiraceae bacterium]